MLIMSVTSLVFCFLFYWCCNSVDPELYVDGTDYMYWFLQPFYLLGGGHRPQTIYGKLVDQHGEPVPDVEVKFNYQYATSFAFTNEKGEFNCRIGKNYGRKLILGEIKCCGYEWDKNNDQDNRRIYDNIDRNQDQEAERVEEELQRMWYSTTRRKRHVVVLRKKDKSSYLLAIGPIKLGLNGERPDGYVNMATYGKSYAMKRNELLNSSILMKKDNIPLYDFQFHAQEDRNRGGWTLTIRANGKDAGIQEWKGEKIYEAPKDGYEDSLEITLKYDEFRKLHIYARTRDKSLYSEFDLEVYAAPLQQKDGKETSWANIQFKNGYFNPFGKRDMEKDDGYLRVRTNRLENEIRNIVRTGVIPDEEEYKKLRVFPDYRKIRHEWYESARKKKPLGWWLW